MLAGVIIIVVLLLLLPLICLIYIIMICKCLIVFEFYYRNGSGDHFCSSCCSYFGEFKLNPNRICNTSRNSSIPGGHHYSMTSIEPGPSIALRWVQSMTGQPTRQTDNKLTDRRSVCLGCVVVRCVKRRHFSSVIVSIEFKSIQKIIRSVLRFIHI